MFLSKAKLNIQIKFLKHNFDVDINGIMGAIAHANNEFNLSLPPHNLDVIQRTDTWRPHNLLMRFSARMIPP